MKQKKHLIKIWGDIVEIKSLILSIIISSVFTMSLYFLAPKDDLSKQLFYGLLGAVIGFIISSILIKPKRIIKQEEDKE